MNYEKKRMIRRDHHLAEGDHLDATTYDDFAVYGPVDYCTLTTQDGLWRIRETLDEFGFSILQAADPSLKWDAGECWRTVFVGSDVDQCLAELNHKIRPAAEENPVECSDCDHEFADGDEKFTWHRAYDMVAADRKETLCKECIDSWVWFRSPESDDCEPQRPDPAYDNQWNNYHMASVDNKKGDQS